MCGSDFSNVIFRASYRNSVVFLVCSQRNSRLPCVSLSRVNVTVAVLQESVLFGCRMFSLYLIIKLSHVSLVLDAAHRLIKQYSASPMAFFTLSTQIQDSRHRWPFASTHIRSVAPLEWPSPLCDDVWNGEDEIRVSFFS